MATASALPALAAAGAFCGGNGGDPFCGAPMDCDPLLDLMSLHHLTVPAASAFTPWVPDAGTAPPTAAAPARRGPAPAAARLPLELLGSILQLVLEDDAANSRRQAQPRDAQRQRPPPPPLLLLRGCTNRHHRPNVVQFVSRSWLAAYRSVAYRRISLLVGPALRRLQQRSGGSEEEAGAALLRGLAARLPHASEVVLVALPPAAAPPAEGRPDDSGAPAAAATFRWRLGELLVEALGGSSRLRRLCVDFLPHLPPLLARRLHLEARGQPGLERLGIAALPARQLLVQLPLLRLLPLHSLGVADAACLPEGEASELAAALAGLGRLSCLSLGGTPAADAAADAAAAAARACRAGSPPPPPHASPVSLPSLALVAAAAGLPSLAQLELSLTFSNQQSALQQDYLHQLGCVLRAQRREHEARAAPTSSGAAASRVSVTVHEHVQGDLSALPVASCSLNLDWDDESNPIEVWQCSTLRRLRIAAQLPLQAGQFRPARLAALQVLEVAGCCYIPAYFADALASMHQLHRLSLSDCQLEAVAAVPWQQVLPCLPLLEEVAVERCSGAVLLPTLWIGLAGCCRLRRLRITGRGLAPPGPRAAADPAVAPLQPHPAAMAGALGWAHLAAAAQPGGTDLCAAACGVPDCVALLQRLRRLDLSHNGLHALPDSLAWCQQLTSMTLRGNRLQSVPSGVALLAGLRKLDLTSNQLADVPDGPYVCQLEELLLGGNLALLPRHLPAGLMSARRLRRLGLPLWWQLAGAGEPQRGLLAQMPWLALEHS